MTTHTRQVNFRLPKETEEALQMIKERDGIPISEQVRRALLLWLAQKGAAPKKGKR